jgi:hypothetical protein
MSKNSICNEFFKYALVCIIFLMALFPIVKFPLAAFDLDSKCAGKAELAAAYVHVDFLQSHKTIHKMNLAAVRGEVNWNIWSGLILKPMFLYGHGKNKDSVIQAGVGLGFLIPVYEQICITPTVGVQWGWLKTTLAFENPFDPANDIHFREKFRSVSPYVGFELTYTICQGWRVVGCVQYCWSKTHTIVSPLIDEKSHSEGFAYSGMIEYDLCENWSINVGGAYNNSLTKEKDGIRAYGGKLGIAYWF